ncbi:MAG: hypothetical protein ACRDKB_00450 [Actinomycetota bacterium]
MKLRSAVLWLLAVTMAATLPAHADQLRAIDEPVVRGPLRFETEACQRKRKVVNGRVAAVARSCLRFYSFDPGLETDARRDYGVAWLQTVVNPKPGWCARAVRSDLLIPDGVRLHARAPANMRTNKPERRVARLRVDARGSAEEIAGVRQPFRLHPRRLTRSERNEGAVYSTNWVGGTGRKVAVPSGLELSWRASNPEVAIDFRVGFRIDRSEDC